MKKIFPLILLILLITACGTRVTWEAAIARGSMYYESASDQSRLNNAVNSAVSKIKESDIPLKERGAVVQVVDNEINNKVIDLVYAALKKDRVTFEKIREDDKKRANYDYLLYVYPVTYGIKQEGTVFPNLIAHVGSGMRIAEVSIYARLYRVKDSTIVWDNTFDSIDNSSQAVYSFPVFDSDSKKVDMMIQQSQSGQQYNGNLNGNLR